MNFFAVFSPSQASPAEIFAQSKISRLGFRWRAFAFGPLYALARGWLLASALWLVFLAALAFLALALGLSAAAVALIMLIASIGFGFEAEEFERMRLERSGLSLACIALGATREDVENFYLARAHRQEP